MRSQEAARAQEFREFVAMTRSDHPETGLPDDWFSCRERYLSDAHKAEDRVVCQTTTAQGITSTLIALKKDGDRVPVVESRLAGTPENSNDIVDIDGGPGGETFHIGSAMTKDEIDKLRRMGVNVTGEAGTSPYHMLLERGFTVASVGYGATRIRTLNARDEIEVAIGDVRTAIDFYRDKNGAEPALIMSSLGNHIALGTLGKNRLGGMNFLALVPVMDGLQHHLRQQGSTHPRRPCGKQ